MATQNIYYTDKKGKRQLVVDTPEGKAAANKLGWTPGYTEPKPIQGPMTLQQTQQSGQPLFKNSPIVNTIGNVANTMLGAVGGFIPKPAQQITQNTLNQGLNQAGAVLQQSTPTKAAIPVNLPNKPQPQTNNPTQTQTTPQSLQPNISEQILATLQAIQNANAQQQPQQYASPYSNQIEAALSAILNRPQFQFNENDPMIKNAQDNVASAVTREFARRNLLGSQSNQFDVAKAVTDVLPRFRQQQLQEYDMQGNQLNNILSTLNQLEGQNYGRSRDAIADQRYNAESELENLYRQLGVFTQLENQNFNRSRQSNLDNAAMTGYYNPLSNVDIPDEVYQYSNNYQAEINRRRATPDATDDALIPALESARINKIISDPGVREQYGQPFRTMQGQEFDANMEANRIQQEIDIAKIQAANDPMNPENQLKMIQVAKAEQELRQLMAVDPNLENLKSQAEIAKIKADIARINSSTAENIANISNINARTANELNSGSKIDKNQMIATVTTALDQALQNGKNPIDLLKSYKSDIIKDLGKSTYDQLVTQYSPDQSLEQARVYEQARNNYLFSNRWVNSPEDAFTDLQNNKLAQQMMGKKNYNNLLQDLYNKIN